MILIRYVFFYLGFFLVFTPQIRAKVSHNKFQLKKNKIPFLAYGNIYGEIEPCGCDPLTDLGGIRRLSSLVSQVRAQEKSILVFDLGNNYDPTQIDKSQTFHLKQALDLIKADASLVNQIELDNPKKTLGERSYVLSNASSYFLKKTKKISSYLSFPNTLVFGFLESKNSKKNLIYNLKTLIDRWKKIIKKEQKKHVVLLFSGADKLLEQLGNKEIFTLIISANTKTKKDLKIYSEQKKNYLLLRQFDSFHVKMTPSLGRGVLTHKTTTKFEGGLFGKKTFGNSFTKIQKKKISFLPKAPVYWLSKKYDKGSPLEAFLDEYNSFKKNTFKKLALIRQKDLKNSAFVGAEACKNCHQKAYKIWKKSKHSHAFATLKAKNKTEDSSCITCHVVAWKEKGGFASESLSPQFKNIQCENCHGPRKKHVENPLSKPHKKHLSLSQACQACHNASHSPQFNKEKYWNEISHF